MPSSRCFSIEIFLSCPVCIVYHTWKKIVNVLSKKCIAFHIDLRLNILIFSSTRVILLLNNKLISSFSWKSVIWEKTSPVAKCVNISDIYSEDFSLFLIRWNSKSSEFSYPGNGLCAFSGKQWAIFNSIALEQKPPSIRFIYKLLYKKFCLVQKMGEILMRLYCVSIIDLDPMYLFNAVAIDNSGYIELFSTSV